MQGQILVVKEPITNMTKSGFYLPDTAAEKALEKGTVISCGAWVEGVDCTKIVEGSKVLYVKWAASDIETDDEKYQLIRYEDVKAVMEDAL